MTTTAVRLLPEMGPVTIAHDYFTQRGGAERVAASLIEHLQPSSVLTAVYERSATFPLDTDDMTISLLQRFRFFRKDPRRALVLLPLAWRLMPRVTSGIVICSSSGWSHRIRTSGGAVKVVYCHNPPRWLYQSSEYLAGCSWTIRAIMAIARPFLLIGDRAAARSADLYIANSRSVADRVQSAYGITATVIYPPSTLASDGPRERPPLLDSDDFFLTVGRSRGYKNTEHLLEAFRDMPERRLVVVGRLDGKDVPPNVQILGVVPEEQLRWLYAHARALVSVSAEDFGLTPIEANGFGTPALLLRAGGFLDSMAEGVSGQYIENSDPATIADAVRAFPSDWDRALVELHAAQFSLDAFADKLRQAIEPQESPVPVLIRTDRDERDGELLWN